MKLARTNALTRSSRRKEALTFLQSQSHRWIKSLGCRVSESATKFTFSLGEKVGMRGKGAWISPSGCDYSTGSRHRTRAMTRMDLLIFLAALLILVALMLPGFLWPRHEGRVPRLQCLNNLKQICLAYRVWEADNNHTYPMFVPQTNGGSMEFTTGMNAFHHYQVMSNELSTPKVLFCPSESDPQRFVATNFAWLNNSNLSFFVGIVSNELSPQMILSGDHNLTNGTAIKNGLLEITSGHATGWTEEMHKKGGNVALSDGSVHRVNSDELQNLVVVSRASTNFLQMPVTFP
jgi:hypothetical protein